MQVTAGKNILLVRHAWNSSMSIYRNKKERQEITLEYINLKSKRDQHDSESKGAMLSVAFSYRMLPDRALNTFTVILSLQV